MNSARMLGVRRTLVFPFFAAALSVVPAWVWGNDGGIPENGPGSVTGTGTRTGLVLPEAVSPTVSTNEPVTGAMKPVEGRISISFMQPGKAIFAGTVQTEGQATALFERVRSIRPDLRIVYDDLTVDAEAGRIPVLEEIPGFIEELALTHQGYISSKPGEFLVSCLTDSSITRTIFKTRLDLIGDGSLQTRNLVCEVPTADLPDASQDLPEAITEVTEYFPKMPERTVAVTGGELGEFSGYAAAAMATASSAGLIHPADLGAPASAIGSLDLAGLEMSALNSRDAGLLMPDRLDWLFTDVSRMVFQSTAPIVARVVVAEPTQAAAGAILSARPIEPSMAAEEAGATKAPRRSLVGRFLMKAKPKNKPKLVVLAPVQFAERNFTVGVDQMQLIADQARGLTSGERADDKVVLSARVGGNGAAAFNEWISQRRVNEVKRMLMELGVNEDRVTTEMKAALQSDGNPHRVDILVPAKEVPVVANAVATPVEPVPETGVTTETAGTEAEPEAVETAAEETGPMIRATVMRAEPVVATEVPQPVAENETAGNGNADETFNENPTVSESAEPGPSMSAEEAASASIFRDRKVPVAAPVRAKVTAGDLGIRMAEERKTTTIPVSPGGSTTPAENSARDPGEPVTRSPEATPERVRTSIFRRNPADNIFRSE